MKYQDESTKVSIVSVSRSAGCAAARAAAREERAHFLSGLPVPSGTRSSGSTTGRSFSGTGTGPSSGQWMIGIGVPQ